MLLESQKNIGDSILYLFPNTKVNVDFKVIHDGESFKLVEWGINAPIPSLQELESAFERAQVERNSAPKSELDILKETVDQLVLGNLI